MRTCFAEDRPSQFITLETHTIALNLSSSHNTRATNLGHQPRVGDGFVEAIGLALQGQSAFTSEGHIYSFYKNESFGITKDGDLFNTPHYHGLPFTALMQVVLDKPRNSDIADEVEERWTSLVETLEEENFSYPMTDAFTVGSAFAEGDVHDFMLALCDSLYFYCKTFYEGETFSANPTINRSVATEEPHPLVKSQGRPAPALPTLQTLKHALEWGMNTLVIGPTSTFKTTTAKRAALELGMKFVDIKGAPSSDESVLYGSDKTSATSPSGFAFIDGPVTTAFRMARHEKVMLLIDELLRFQKEYLETLIGVMDTYTPDEVRSLGGEPVTEDWNYQLSLSNNERIFCPVNNLVFIATTNVETGFDAGVFSDALRRRFHWIHRLDYPEREVLEPIYKSIFDDQRAVAFALDLEIFTRTNTTAEGGLLERPSNPSVSMTLLKTAKNLVTKGAKLSVALCQASELTLITYCIGYDRVGNPDKDALELLRNEVRNLA